MDDTDAVTEGLGHQTAGNVIDGSGGDLNAAGADTKGADGAVVTGVRTGAEADGGSLTAVSGATLIHGTYGDLTISPGGGYTYKLTTASIPTNVDHETFTYQLTDGDGDTDTAQIVIALNQDQNVPNVGGDTSKVFEDGLADGVQHGANSETDTTGSFVINPHGENYTLTLNSTVVDLVGDTVDTGKGILTITSISVPDGSGNITFGYSYTLSAALTHTGQGEINDITDTITMNITDATGDSDERRARSSCRLSMTCRSPRTTPTASPRASAMPPPATSMTRPGRARATWPTISARTSRRRARKSPARASAPKAAAAR